MQSFYIRKNILPFFIFLCSDTYFVLRGQLSQFRRQTRENVPSISPHEDPAIIIDLTSIVGRTENPVGIEFAHPRVKICRRNVCDAAQSLVLTAMWSKLLRDCNCAVDR